jgi:hypothetical protein
MANVVMGINYVISAKKVVDRYLKED